MELSDVRDEEPEVRDEVFVSRFIVCVRPLLSICLIVVRLSPLLFTRVSTVVEGLAVVVVALVLALVLLVLGVEVEVRELVPLVVVRDPLTVAEPFWVSVRDEVGALWVVVVRLLVSPVRFDTPLVLVRLDEEVEAEPLVFGCSFEAVV